MSVFQPDPDLVPGDRVRLSYHLRSWNALNEILLVGEVSIEDLKKMVLIEREGKNRIEIQKKLVGRIQTLERAEILTRLGHA